MTNREIAEANYRQYLKADFEHMMNRGLPADPSAYGLRGNMMHINGDVFHVYDLTQPTAPIHAGF